MMHCQWSQTKLLYGCKSRSINIPCTFKSVEKPSPDYCGGIIETNYNLPDELLEKNKMVYIPTREQERRMFEMVSDTFRPAKEYRDMWKNGEQDEVIRIVRMRFEYTYPNTKISQTLIEGILFLFK